MSDGWAGDEKTLEEISSRLAIQDLLAAYTDSMNRRRWSELAALFLEEARIELTTLQSRPLELVGPTALARFIGEVTERFDFFQFVVLNSRLELRRGEDAARGRLFICEHRFEKAAGRWTQVFGVYHDRYRRIDGRWWFEHRSFAPLASVANEGRVVEFPSRLDPFLSGDA
jgi:hypothetical protein